MRKMQLRTLLLILPLLIIVLTGCALQMPPSEALVPPTFTPEQQVPVIADEPESIPEAQVSNITPEQQAILAQLKNYGPPPELTNETWLNSEPLQLADLRGNVVIVEFWTYG